MAFEMTQPRDEYWSRAVDFLGETALAFILDLVPGTGPTSNDQLRWDVVEQLGSAPADERFLQPEQKLSLRAHLLTRVSPDSGLTLLEEVRRLISGRTPEQTGDVLVDAFVRLAFNGIAIEHLDGAAQDRFLVSASFQDPALYGPAAEAFLRDPSLNSLFPKQDDEVDSRGQRVAIGLLTWLTADGGTTDLRIAVGSIVAQTLARMRFDKRLDEESLVEYVRQTLDDLRSAAHGRKVTVTILSGLVGVQVDEPVDRGTWGLAPATDLAIETWPGADHRAPKSVFWVKSTQQLIGRLRNDASETEINAAFSKLHELASVHTATLRRDVMRLQFCIAAWAAERDQIVDVTATWHWSLFPMARTPAPFVTTPHAGLPDAQLGKADLDEIAATMDEIGDVTDRLDVALTRIIRASSERRDPADALIDAVVAWENMLGSKTETTFKVCAALAWLLEPDDQMRRVASFGRAKKLYAARSDLVHGSSSSIPDDLHELSREALVMAIRAYRRIHAFPELKDIKASTRSEHLLLQR
ncbi:HEPN domain-containing protein [Sanguibacter sp. HDW7]|uniref:HEPN domain-containing protein n=1 Tax=Sanguibacter sp. HDW7 TaxID=2714931 RepID=UPI0014089470|nr:HEPN domain-containing protein [Sanguibacter sp. HDW7]QIK83138.1 hypothetical protein G7063_05475 [Sanguibacter sp. HDW7]